MKFFIVTCFLSLSSACVAQENDYWELYESYAAGDSIKYHEILQSLESGNIEEAKKKLLSFQSAEIEVLKRLKVERGISQRSERVIKFVEQSTSGAAN